MRHLSEPFEESFAFGEFELAVEFLDPGRSPNEDLNSTRVANEIWFVLLGDTDLPHLRTYGAGKHLLSIQLCHRNSHLVTFRQIRRRLLHKPTLRAMRESGKWVSGLRADFQHPRVGKMTWPREDCIRWIEWRLRELEGGKPCTAPLTAQDCRIWLAHERDKKSLGEIARAEYPRYWDVSRGKRGNQQIISLVRRTVERVLPQLEMEKAFLR